MNLSPNQFNITTNMLRHKINMIMTTYIDDTAILSSRNNLRKSLKLNY